MAAWSDSVLFAALAQSVQRRLREIEPLVDHLLPGHNVGLVDAAYLGRMAAAFEQISAGGGTYRETDGNRQYQFEGFSIIVAGGRDASADE